MAFYDKYRPHLFSEFTADAKVIDTVRTLVQNNFINILFVGDIGTGKTTMLRLTRELAQSQGYEIRGITAGSSAAHELKQKGGLEAATFARELGLPEGDLSTLEND